MVRFCWLLQRGELLGFEHQVRLLSLSCLSAAGPVPPHLTQLGHRLPDEPRPPQFLR